MASLRTLQLLAVVLSSFCVLARAEKVTLGGFSTSYGVTGCISDPTKGCGRKGDICYSDRGNAYAFTGTAPMCNACMPKNYRNIATYKYPTNLPCAIWNAYDCDDYFVTYLWYKSGSKSCWIVGEKSYNIENTFSSAKEAQDEFVRRCREKKSASFYGLSDDQRISERDYCSPERNNITDITILGEDNKVLSVLSDYKEYYDNKFKTSSTL